MRHASALLILTSTLSPVACGDDSGGDSGTGTGGTATTGSSVGTGTTGTTATTSSTTTGATGTTTGGTTASSTGGSDTGTGGSDTGTGGSTGGGMCDPGLVACGMACVDPDSDVAHCGGCDNFCGPGSWSCEMGVCVEDRGWIGPVPISGGETNGIYPTPRADANGDATVVWWDLDAESVVAASYDGQLQSWGPFGSIGTQNDFVQPSFAMDAASGSGFAAWRFEPTPVDAKARGAFFDGAIWGAEQTDLATLHLAPSMKAVKTAKDEDKTVLVYTGLSGPDARIMARTHDGMNWGAEVALDWAPDPTWGVPSDFDLAIAPGTGFAVAVWTQWRKDTQKYVLSANGFGGPELIADLPGDASFPSIGIDGSNRAVVVWRQRDPGTQYGIYAKHFENGWSAEVPLMVDANKDVWPPKVAVNAAGDAMAVFGQDDGMGGIALWAMRYDRASDTWAPAQLVDQAAAGNFDSWDVALDAAGNAMVAWRRADGGQVNAYARHYVVVANVWEPVEPLEGAMGDVTQELGVTADGLGNFLVAWSQQAGPVAQIFTAWYR